eukprot:6761290-Pyramimonas_sp.AAC.1
MHIDVPIRLRQSLQHKRYSSPHKLGPHSASCLTSVARSAPSPSLGRRRISQLCFARSTQPVPDCG